jgi:hypothetical protein
VDLILKSRGSVRFSENTRKDCFYRHRLSQLKVFGFIYFSHTACRTEAHDLESTGEDFCRLEPSIVRFSFQIEVSQYRRGEKRSSLVVFGEEPLDSARRLTSGHRSFKNEERRAGSSSKAASNSALTVSQLCGCVAMACFQSATLQSPEESDGCPHRETDWPTILTTSFSFRS